MADEANAVGATHLRAGHRPKRRRETTAVFARVPDGFPFLLDIDRPQGGSLTVSQQPIIDLQEQMEADLP